MKVDLSHSRNGILILAAAGAIAAGTVADRAFDVHAAGTDGQLTPTVDTRVAGDVTRSPLPLERLGR